MNNSLFVAWRSGEPTKGGWGPVGRLDRGAAGYRFVYTRGARLLEGFTPFPGMFDLDAVYESEELFPLFKNRLLARSRPEYEAFLAWGGFDPNNQPDPIAILGVTEGRRATDALEVFPCPTPDASGCYTNKFFLHGVRYNGPDATERIQQLRLQEPLGLVREHSNESDPNAVAVLASGTSGETKIGYVPRYLARDVGDLLSKISPNAKAMSMVFKASPGLNSDRPESQTCESLTLTVERVNTNAPLQQRVLCRMNAYWPHSFRPCARDEFQPIVGELSSMPT